MFRDLIQYQEIAEQYGLKYQSVRRYAMRQDWPPAERVIGRTKFFAKIAVADFFKTLKRQRRK